MDFCLRKEHRKVMGSHINSKLCKTNKKQSQNRKEHKQVQPTVASERLLGGLGKGTKGAEETGCLDSVYGLMYTFTHKCIHMHIDKYTHSFTIFLEIHT